MGKTIYQYGDFSYGSVSLLKKRRFFFGFKGFFLGGIFALLVIFSPLLISEFSYRLSRLQNQKIVVADINAKEKGETFGDLIKARNIKILKPKDVRFGIVIPKINLNSQVLANVDASNPGEYLAALKSGAAHAKGSYFPGENGSIYIFAHSTDYVWNFAQFNAIFYLLKELEKNDEINLFYQGKRYIYQVTDKKFVTPSNISYLKSRNQQEILILQTCWPPGTTLNRLLIFAEPSAPSDRQVRT